MYTFMYSPGVGRAELRANLPFGNTELALVSV